jgi:uncharacterized membrane protein
MNAMKLAGIVTAIILFVYAIVLVGQIWGSWMEWSSFIKLTITAGVIIVAVGIIALIYRELIQERSLKKDNYID